MKYIKRVILLAMFIPSIGVAATITTINNIDVGGVAYNATIFDNFAETDGTFYDFNFVQEATAALVVHFNADFSTYNSSSAFFADACTRTMFSCSFWTSAATIGGQGAVLGYDYLRNRYDFSYGVVGTVWKNTFVGENDNYVQWTEVSSVPVPAAVWLMSSGLVGLLGYTRKNNKQS